MKEKQKTFIDFFHIINEAQDGLLVVDDLDSSETQFMVDIMYAICHYNDRERERVTE